MTSTLQPKTLDPRRAFEQAAALHAQGRLWEAEQFYERALAGDARHFESVYRLGLVRLQQGRFAEAEPVFRRAIKLDKRSADAHHHLAICLTGMQRFQEAVARYEKALTLRPRFAEAHNNLGYALQMLGRHEEAARHYRSALAFHPAYAEALNNLGNALGALGRNEEAVSQFQQALAINSAYPEAHNNLGSALMALNRHEEAVAHCEQAVALRPDYVEAHLNLANALVTLGRFDEGAIRYRKVTEIDPSHAEAHSRLGRALAKEARPQEAIPHYERALAIDPNLYEAYNGFGTALQTIGSQQKAIEAFEKAIAVEPRRTSAYWHLVMSTNLRRDDPRFAAMQQLAREVESLDTKDQIDLRFALGKVLAEHGDHEQSFQHLLEGNQLVWQQLAYDEPKTMALFERIRAVFTTDLLREMQGIGDRSCVPIFIVGMPRSGTTLIEQILSSQGEVFGAGELKDFANLSFGIRGRDDAEFPEYMADVAPEQLRELARSYLEALQRRAPTAKRIVDKMPYNFKLIGLVHLLLPNARIIHTRRDPRDIALSCFSLIFGDGHEFTYDLGALGRYIRAYETLMEHWRRVLPAGAMLEVQYEDIVEHLEEQARRIVRYCGLEWDDACLAFHKTERVVGTASVNQVRQPIYRSSIGRWRFYESQMQPLLKALDGD